MIPQISTVTPVIILKCGCNVKEGYTVIGTKSKYTFMFYFEGSLGSRIHIAALNPYSIFCKETICGLQPEHTFPNSNE